MIKVIISNYTIEDMKILHYNMLNGAKSIKTAGIFIIIAIGITITGLFIPSESISTLGLIATSINIVSVSQGMYAPKRSLESFNNLQKHHNNLPICVRFDETCWHTSFGDNPETVIRFDYSFAYGAVETAEYFFMNGQKGSYFCVPKRCFINGTPDELRQLLSEKFGEKFEVKNITKEVI